MAQQSENKRPIRFRLRKSSMLVKVALIAVLILSIAALWMINGGIQSEEAQKDAQRQQAAALEQDLDKLEQDIQDLGTVEGIIRIAREQLGLVDPDTIIIEPKN